MYTLVFTEDAKKDLKELSKKGEIREDKYSDVKIMNHRYRNSFLEKRILCEKSFLKKRKAGAIRWWDVPARCIYQFYYLNFASSNAARCTVRSFIRCISSSYVRAGMFASSLYW